MEGLQNTFKAASATFGLIPGITILISELGVPPDASSLLFGAIIESIGALTILYLVINRGKIRAYSIDKISKLIKWFGICFVLFTIFYTALYNFYVFESTSYERSILMPFVRSKEIDQKIEAAGGVLKAIDRYGPQTISDLIQDTTRTSIIITETVFLIVYLLIFEFLTIAFGFAGLRVKEKK